MLQAPISVATLVPAICWNLITGYAGILSSSSHALIGGLLGAAGMWRLPFLPQQVGSHWSATEQIEVS